VLGRGCQLPARRPVARATRRRRMTNGRVIPAPSGGHRWRPDRRTRGGEPHRRPDHAVPPHAHRLLGGLAAGDRGWTRRAHHLVAGCVLERHQGTTGAPRAASTSAPAAWSTKWLRPSRTIPACWTSSSVLSSPPGTRLGRARWPAPGAKATRVEQKPTRARSRPNGRAVTLSRSTSRSGRPTSAAQARRAKQKTTAGWSCPYRNRSSTTLSRCTSRPGGRLAWITNWELPLPASQGRRR
jgi:hypothetical protein